MSDQFKNIVEENVAKLSKVAPKAVLTNCLLWTGVAFITIIGFNILRPKNKIIYEPKVKYHTGGKPPPKISDGFFSWLPPLLHTKEPELVDKIGLDATVFLRFLRMMRWLFLAISIVLCAMLLPVNITAGLKNKKHDELSILTIKDVSGTRLYTHIAAVYVVTFMVFGFVWYHWRHMLRLRTEWFASDEYQKSFYARTVMVTDVPRKMQTDQGLTTLLQSLQIPYPTTSVHIGRRVGKLPELVEYHNDAVRKLETHLVRYLKGGKIGKKRPVETTGGCMGMGGEKRDAIDMYTAKLKKTEGAIELWRSEIDLKQAENYGFASLAAVPYAHIVAHRLSGKTAKGTTVTMAPNPKDIIWTNLNLSPAERGSKRTMGWVWMSLFAFLNTFPLLVISFFANLSSLQAYIPFLRDWAKSSPDLFSLASAILPPTISALFGYFLPIVMRKLSQYQGATTHTRLDRAVIARYFAFLVISQLIIFSLIGILFNSVTKILEEIGEKSFSEILKNLNTLPNKIPDTYISQSNYWLTFFPLRGFLAVFDLAQIINLVWVNIKTHFFGRTPRDIREWTQPAEFEYAVYYSNLLFMGTVALVFAPIAPLVTVGATAVFWVSSAVHKYQLMFVFITKIESGGRLWNVVINRLLASLVLMQLLMTLTITLRMGFTSYRWIATLPPILFVPVFKYWLTKQFDRPFRWYLPSEEVVRKTQVFSANADNQGHRLEKRFGHPALYADLFTPMVHAKMVNLLPQVYHGRLEQTTTTMDEYAGKKMEAQVLPGGIKIAGIEQNDLEFDPALYGRDRGELDWDRMSMHSSHMLNDAGSFVRDKMNVPINRIQGYLHHGPMSSMSKRGSEHIELGRIDSRSDAWPLLHANNSTPGGIETPYEGMHQYPPGVPYDTQRSMTPGGSRPMTPLQTRPMTPQGGHAQSPSGNWAGHAQSPSGNWAGHAQSPSGNWSAGGPQQRNVPGQPFMQPQAPILSQPVPPNPHARGRSFDALNAPSAYQQPPPQQHGYGGPSGGGPMYHDRTPSANSETRPGDYFNPQRVASPQQSPGGLMMGGRVSPMPRLGTPQQQQQQQYQQYHQQQGRGPSPQRGPSRQPSFDQLRQHQLPSPGGQYQQQSPGGPPGFSPQGPYRR